MARVTKDEAAGSRSGTLRLTEPERAHLYLLAGLNPPRVGGARGAAVTPELRRLLGAWTLRPAMLLDGYWNLLAINDAARTVFGPGSTYFRTDNHARIPAAAAPQVASTFS
ncbi:MAG TPA: hypothetical protein VJT72_23715 [Pseudonocardiaceae bacterium]|nr:hypothetical protein [Pseudonocardiaceae bacterium]